MNPADRLVRTRVYLDPEHLAKCKVLADRYHTNRSEVIRVALNHGLGLAPKDLKRRQRARSARAAVPPDSRARSGVPPTTADLSEQLRQYAETLLALDGHRPEAELRLLVKTQATVLQVPAVELEDVVDEVITMLPSVVDDDEESEDGVQRREPPE